MNAWFLNKYGTESIAIITSDTETNSTLNDAPILDYEAIVQKQDNRFVETYFSTMSASIYPITNEIRIPSVNEKFPVKYIPGYEKNIVILYNQTREGIARRQYEKLAPINEAKNQIRRRTNQYRILGRVYIGIGKLYKSVSRFRKDSQNL